MARNEHFAKWPKNSRSPLKKYLETSTNTAMLFLSPFDTPKRAKNGHAQKVPLVGQTHKNKFLSCSIHHFESPCKKSAQTDKRFLRYSFFKSRWIWFAESFSAICWAKKWNCHISTTDEARKILLYSILTRNGEFWWFLGSKLSKRSKKGRKKSYRLVYLKKLPKIQKKNFSHLKSVIFWKAIPKFYIEFLWK